MLNISPKPETIKLFPFAFPLTYVPLHNSFCRVLNARMRGLDLMELKEPSGMEPPQKCSPFLGSDSGYRSSGLYRGLEGFYHGDT